MQIVRRPGGTTHTATLFLEASDAAAAAKVDETSEEARSWSNKPVLRQGVPQLQVKTSFWGRVCVCVCMCVVDTVLFLLCVSWTPYRVCLYVCVVVWRFDM